MVTKIAFDIRKNIKVERFGFGNAKIIEFLNIVWGKKNLKSSFFLSELTWVSFGLFQLEPLYSGACAAFNFSMFVCNLTFIYEYIS